MMNYDREIAALRAELRRLRHEVYQRPIKPPKTISGVYTLTIDRGNTLSDGSTLGIKWAGTAPTTVPSLYDPNVDTAYIDGIGRATLRINGSSQGFVLVTHYTGNGSPLNLALVQNQVVETSAATISLPLASDATQSVLLFVPYSP